MSRTLAIYYEHPDWFRPLFAELDRRAVPYVTLDATHHSYDPSEVDNRYTVVFNRMSPSAYLRGHGHGIFYTLQYLNHLESLGTRVVNGQQAFAIEISKARQLSLLDSLNLRYPKARVINTPSLAVAASEGLRFPVLVKANIGGSGAGIVRFDSRAALIDAAENGKLELGIDQTALVQEFVPPRDGHITRVETLGGKYLYGINVFTTGDTFNLCPADICQTTDGVELTRVACPVDAPRSGLQVEAFEPPPEVIRSVERIVQAAQIDVGGVEYIIDDRDGSLLYYDINALSNFVADASRVLGFDPHAMLVDFLQEEVRRCATVTGSRRRSVVVAV
jgi:glutathione synthase/RimK-type ligase-like ATP-grasp enzyme